MNEPRVLVLLCTYNERGNLPEVLKQLWSVLPQADVLVVDDNSPDGTGEWVAARAASEPRLHLLARSGKLGLGSALRDGIAWCLTRQYDYLLNFDADRSHDPRVAPELLRTAVAGAVSQAGPATGPGPAMSPGSAKSPGSDTGLGSMTVAIGSRYVAGGASTGLTPLRKAISRLLNAYAALLLRLPVGDCSGSYRCYPVALLRQLELPQLRCNGYGFLEEILVHLRGRGARFVEVPITYHARGAGSSKLSFSDAWGAIAVIHRLALSPPAASSPPPAARF
jgi:dolichol-phosphate mannosyltransferase